MIERSICYFKMRGDRRAKEESGGKMIDQF